MTVRLSRTQSQACLSYAEALRTGAIANASAATIASMGAKHISIESSAMYLVHKCSSGLFNVGSFNADQLQDVIKEAKQMTVRLSRTQSQACLSYAEAPRTGAIAKSDLKKKDSPNYP